MKHVNDTELSSYLAEDLSDAEEEMIEIHLADCDSCTARARRLFQAQIELYGPPEWMDEAWKTFAAGALLVPPGPRRSGDAER